MFKYSIISLLLLVLNCRSGYSQSRAEKQCNMIKQNYQSGMGNYILGGKEASLGEVPYMVAVGFSKTTGNNDYKCGGSLVSNTCIVTAAHCVNTNESVVVRIGSTDISNTKFNPKTDHNIARKVIHPQYDSTKFYNDLAILTLNSPVAFSRNVYPICLATNKAVPQAFLVISGWGYSTRNGPMQSRLQIAEVLPVSNKDCSALYSSKDSKLSSGITSELLCAGGKTRTRPCPGDSGVPLVLPGKNGASRLLGTASFGRSTCNTPYPGGFIRISSYADWIANTCNFPN